MKNLTKIIDRWLKAETEKRNYSWKLFQEFRIEKDLTQKQLAEMLGASHTQIWHIENQKRVPSYELLSKLLEIMINNEIKTNT